MKSRQKIPAGEDRGPRDKKVAIYLTEEEDVMIGDVAENWGFD